MNKEPNQKLLDETVVAIVKAVQDLGHTAELILDEEGSCFSYHHVNVRINSFDISFELRDENRGRGWNPVYEDKILAKIGSVYGGRGSNYQCVLRSKTFKGTPEKPLKTKAVAQALVDYVVKLEKSREASEARQSRIDALDKLVENARYYAADKTNSAEFGSGFFVSRTETAGKIEINFSTEEEARLIIDALYSFRSAKKKAEQA